MSASSAGNYSLVRAGSAQCSVELDQQLEEEQRPEHAQQRVAKEEKEQTEDKEGARALARSRSSSHVSVTMFESPSAEISGGGFTCAGGQGQHVDVVVSVSGGLRPYSVQLARDGKVCACSSLRHVWT